MIDTQCLKLLLESLYDSKEFKKCLFYMKKEGVVDHMLELKCYVQLNQPCQAMQLIPKIQPQDYKQQITIKALTMECLMKQNKF
jgi:hypothetical protein